MASTLRQRKKQRHRLGPRVLPPGSDDSGDFNGSESLGDPSDSFDHVGNAQKQWERFFRKDAYTNFTEVEYLRRLARKSWEALLEDPKLLARCSHDERIRGDMSARKTETWRRPGRCTSFALVVVNALEQEFPGKYNFRYYDVGDHRLARCATSGVIIDSSSRVGVIVSRDNQWSQRDTVGQSWGKIHGVSKLNRGNKLVSQTHHSDCASWRIRMLLAYLITNLLFLHRKSPTRRYLLGKQ